MIQKETHRATPGLSLTLKPKCAVSPEPQPPRLVTQQKSHEAQVRQHDTSSPEVSKSAALAVTRHDTRQADQILSLCHLGLKSQSLRITASSPHLRKQGRRLLAAPSGWCFLAFTNSLRRGSDLPSASALIRGSQQQAAT